MIRLLAAITEGTHNIQEEPPLPEKEHPEESTVKPTVVTDDGEPCSMLGYLFVFVLEFPL